MSVIIQIDFSCEMESTKYIHTLHVNNDVCHFMLTTDNGTLKNVLCYTFGNPVKEQAFDLDP